MVTVTIRRVNPDTGQPEQPETHTRDSAHRAWLTGVGLARRFLARTDEPAVGPGVGTRVTVEGGPDATWDGQTWVHSE